MMPRVNMTIRFINQIEQAYRDQIAEKASILREDFFARAPNPQSPPRTIGFHKSTVRRKHPGFRRNNRNMRHKQDLISLIEWQIEHSTFHQLTHNDFGLRSVGDSKQIARLRKMIDDRIEKLCQPDFDSVVRPHRLGDPVAI